MTTVPLVERRNPELASLAAQNGLAVAGARPGLIAYIHSTWKYRHFTSAFSTAGVVASLNTHRLGRLWQVLTPLTNALVYYLIFGVIIGTKGRVHNFIAYLCIGVFLFTFSSQSVQKGVQAITKNLGMVRALHFPRSTLPISNALAELQNLLYSMIVLVAIVLITGEPIRWTWLAMIPLIGLLTMFNIGLAMFMARVGNKIPDLKQILPFVMRTWMYSSGVMYSATIFDEHLDPFFAHLALANPLVVYIEIAREALMLHPNQMQNGKILPPIMSHSTLVILAVSWAIIGLVGGFIYFWRGEQEYGRG